MRLLVLLLLLAPLAACDEPSPLALSPAEAAERDSVLALLRNADTDALAAAFDRLDAFRYHVETRTEQFGADGEPVAYRTVAAEVTPTAEGPHADIAQTDSAGAFDFGRFAALAADAPEGLLPAENPASLILPEDPAFLDPRGQEAFTFHIAPDTLLDDRRVRVLTVDARPGEGDDQRLRHARLYLDAGGALVGLRMRQRLESVIFSEVSDTVVLLHPDPAGGWLPRLTRFDTTVGTLFTDRRRFRLVRRYSDFRPAALAGA